MEPPTDNSSSRAQRVAIVNSTVPPKSSSSSSSSSTVVGVPVNYASSDPSTSNLTATTVDTLLTPVTNNRNISSTASSSSSSVPVVLAKAPIGVPVFLNNPSTTTTSSSSSANRSSTTTTTSTTSSLSSSVSRSTASPAPSLRTGIAFWRNNNRVSSSSSSSSSSSTVVVVNEKARKAWIQMTEIRVQKWFYMLRNWDEWLNDSKLQLKIRKRCRKGIPEKLRGTVWMVLTDAARLRKQNSHVYSALLVEPVETTLVDAKALGVGINPAPSMDPSSSSSSSTLLPPIYPQPHINTCNITGTNLVLPSINHNSLTSSSSSTTASSSTGTNHTSTAPPRESFRGIIDTIERDISRTFPSLEMFHETMGNGQAQLFRILIAYSRYDPEVSYCQGMGFIVALFLTYLTEEDAFWLLVSIMRDKKHALHTILSPGLPLVDMKLHTIQGLLNYYVPQLSQHLSNELIHCTMYATQWILTVYIYSFPFEIVVRIWDAFLYEGWEIVYRIAICILQGHEKVFRNAKSFEEIMDIFKRIPYSITATTVDDRTTANGKDHSPPTDIFLRKKLDIADTLIEQAINLRITQKEINLLEDEWKTFQHQHHPTCGNDAGTVLQRKGIGKLSEPLRQEFLLLQNLRLQTVRTTPTLNTPSDDLSPPGKVVRPVSWGKSGTNSNTNSGKIPSSPNV